MTTILDASNWDNTQALTEGWDLFHVDYDHASGLEIQRIDDPMSVPDLGYDDPKFTDDNEAMAFVVSRANTGSAYHKAALSLWERFGVEDLAGEV